MPFLISVANGPGRIAFSRDATGELVVLPLHPGMELDVREHAFLLCSHQINYSFVRVKGLTNILFGGQGMYMDRFVTTNTPGTADPARLRERVRAPAGRGRKHHGGAGRVSLQRFHGDHGGGVSKLGTGLFGGTNMSLARMTGPGRVGIQSMYVHHKTE